MFSNRFEVKDAAKAKENKYKNIFSIVIILLVICIPLLIVFLKDTYGFDLECFGYIILGISILVEIIWLGYIQNRYNDTFTQSSIEEMCNIQHQKCDNDSSGSKETKMITGKNLDYAKFIAGKTANDNNYLPVLISVASLCISIVDKAKGNGIILLLTIFLLLLLWCISDQKRLNSIEDAVKDYAFKEVLKP